MKNDSGRFDVKIVRRINSKKKRDFRVIFPLDGVKNSIRPILLKDATQVILGKLGDGLIKKADYILALDRGGLVLGLSLSLAKNIPLKIAWKHNLDLGNKIALTDPYIPNEPLYLYGAKKDDRVILVDDEIYSGDTMLITVKDLANKGIYVVAAIAIVECLNFNAREKLEKAGCKLVTYKTYKL